MKGSRHERTVSVPLRTGARADLATNPDAWTAEDGRIGADNFAQRKQATTDGMVILAGRSQDGIGPAIVIFEAESEGDAKRFMEDDPFVTALMR